MSLDSKSKVKSGEPTSSTPAAELPMSSSDQDTHDSYLAILEHARYEAQSVWQIFGLFLLPHTVFLAFTLQALGNLGSVSSRIGLLMAGIAGLLLCIPWYAATLRASEYMRLRMAQARAKEPSDWELIAGMGEDFAEGKAIRLNSRSYRMSRLARLRTTRTILWIVIVFALMYAGMVVVAWLV